MSGPRATTVCCCGTGAFCHQHKRQSFGPGPTRPSKPKITAERLAEALHAAFFDKAPGGLSWCLVFSAGAYSYDEWLAFAEAVLNHLEGRTDEVDR